MANNSSYQLKSKHDQLSRAGAKTLISKLCSPTQNIRIYILCISQIVNIYYQFIVSLFWRFPRKCYQFLSQVVPVGLCDQNLTPAVPCSAEIPRWIQFKDQQLKTADCA